jgi:hypothetical protein
VPKMASGNKVKQSELPETHERKGDRRVAKDQPGPSDPRSKQATTEAKRSGRGETYGGVDAEQNTKQDVRARPPARGRGPLEDVEAGSGEGDRKEAVMTRKDDE